MTILQLTQTLAALTGLSMLMLLSARLKKHLRRFLFE